MFTVSVYYVCFMGLVPESNKWLIDWLIENTKISTEQLLSSHTALSLSPLQCEFEYWEVTPLNTRSKKPDSSVQSMSVCCASGAVLRCRLRVFERAPLGGCWRAGAGARRCGRMVTSRRCTPASRRHLHLVAAAWHSSLTATTTGGGTIIAIR